MEKLHKESYIKTVTASTNYIAQADLTKIQVPTLLLFGSGDKLTPPEAGRIMHAQIKTSTLVVFDDGDCLSLTTTTIVRPRRRRLFLLDDED